MDWLIDILFNIASEFELRYKKKSDPKWIALRIIQIHK